jgi:enoyl-CoA hydratase/carnithine racemase
MPMTHLTIDGPIASISIDNPQGNRINLPMYEELLAAFRRVAQSDVRVLLIRAEGRDFCLGGDIREWAGVPSEELCPKIEIYSDALDQLNRLAIPTVAAVRGRCLGGGLELILSCDLVIAGESAQFGFPEALLGITPLQGGVFHLAQRIGRTRAVEFAFLGEEYTAKKMERLNLVNRVVSDEELEDAAGALVDRLSAGSPRGYATTKILLRAWSAGGLSAARSVLKDISMPLFDTNDVQAALRNAVVAVERGLPFPMARFSGKHFGHSRKE